MLFLSAHWSAGDEIFDNLVQLPSSLTHAPQGEPRDDPNKHQDGAAAAAAECLHSVLSLVFRAIGCSRVSDEAMQRKIK